MGSLRGLGDADFDGLFARRHLQTIVLACGIARQVQRSPSRGDLRPFGPGRRSPMLKPMIPALRPRPLVTPAPAADTRRADWVAEYRRHVPVADRWAHGLRHQAHSIETQERIFRMAEQLAGDGIDRQILFTRLEEADRSVATGVDPEAAANAGYRTIASSVPLVSAPIVICGDGDRPNLRAFGFDPIPFDGHDPAGYAWAMFELTMRARADADPQFGPCTCHPRSAPASIGLARL
jgi:hypothetical protein